MLFSSSTFMFVFLPLMLLVYFVLPGRALKNVWLFAASLVFYAWGEPVYVLLMLASIFCNWLFAIAIGSPGKVSGEADAVELPAGDGSGIDSATGSHDVSGSDPAQPGEPADAPAGTPDQVPLAQPAARKQGLRKFLLVVIVLIDIAVIGFFKYEGFLAQSINALVGMELVPDLELPLPIGISFYTLQALSYVIDVYRGDVKPQRNILYLGMYIACFPQLIAGPIVRYKTIEDQVLHRKENLEDFASGLRLFMVGFAKKVLLSNVVAILAEDMLAMGGENIGAVGAWAGLLAYTFQIYFDFGGYSDMAIGLGRMLGFKYLRNFNYPYISRSVTEFWRRWHISLSSFFRDYIYIPLGGNRVSKPRHILNILIVWATTGLWHGAAWNYILWGLYYGVLLILEKYVWGKALAKLPAVFQHIYTIFIFMMGWALFWITDMGQLSEYLAAMFGAYGACGTMGFWQLGAWEYWPVFVACIVASTPIVPWLKEKMMAWVEKRKVVDFAQTSVVNPKCYDASSLCAYSFSPDCSVARRRTVDILLTFVDIALVVLLVLGLMSVVSGSFNPFIYFQF